MVGVSAQNLPNSHRFSEGAGGPVEDVRSAAYTAWHLCGGNSMAESLPSKQVVEGSSPFRRSDANSRGSAAHDTILTAIQRGRRGPFPALSRTDFAVKAK